MANRVSAAVAAAGGPKVVAERLGVGESSVYGYKSETPGKTYSAPPVTFLVGLSELADVSFHWLVFGVDPTPAPPTESESDWRVPIYNLEVSAGGGAFPDDQTVRGYMSFPEPELRRYGQPNHLALATVKGASMEPELRDQDLVMFDLSARDMRDGVVILRNEDAVLLKRLHVIGKGRIELLSSSPAYNPISLQQGVDDFEVLARVVGKIART